MHNNTVNLYRHAAAKTTRHILCHDMVQGILIIEIINLWKKVRCKVLGIIKTTLDAYFHYMWYILMKSAVYHQFMVLFLYNAWMIRVSFSFLYSTLRMYFVYPTLCTISYLTQTKFILFLICFVACIYSWSIIIRETLIFTAQRCW